MSKRLYFAPSGAATVSMPSVSNADRKAIRFFSSARRIPTVMVDKRPHILLSASPPRGRAE